MLAVGCLIMPVWGGTPSQAKAVRQSYENSLEAWQIKMKLASTPREREALLSQRPKPKEAARRMWLVFSRQLHEEWTLEPAAWFLRLTSQLVEIGADGLPQPVMREEVVAIQQAVGERHLRSRALAPMCMALVACGDQPSMALLRRIEKENPSKEVAGVAALGVAMLAKEIGDDPRVMRERLTMLRKAIIDSADVTVEGMSIAKLAEEELYIILNLSKGSQAPALKGIDSGGRPMSLDSYQGKVVLLVFWNSAGEGSEAVIDWIRALRQDERFANKPFEVVGVNSDPTKNLRSLQADGRVNWPNFSDPSNELGKTYRVGTWPLAYILGQDRKIHYVGSTGPFAELTATAVLNQE